MRPLRKSVRTIVEREAFEMVDDYMPFFKLTGLAREALQDYMVNFFFDCYNKLQKENMIELKGDLV